MSGLQLRWPKYRWSNPSGCWDNYDIIILGKVPLPPSPLYETLVAWVWWGFLNLPDTHDIEDTPYHSLLCVLSAGNLLHLQNRNWTGWRPEDGYQCTFVPDWLWEVITKPLTALKWVLPRADYKMLLCRSTITFTNYKSVSAQYIPTFSTCTWHNKHDDGITLPSFP